MLGRDPLLRFTPGRRVPGVVDGYEIAIRAVLGQQISIQAARDARRAARGRRRRAGGDARAAPSRTSSRPPRRSPPRRTARSRCRSRRRETLRSLAGTPLDELISLPGIGPWTQAYVAMRALRDRDAWLPTDLGVRHALARIGHDGDAERWRPYRAYAVVHLWAMLSSAPERS